MSNSVKKYSCVIWGGYARGNTGDEICLAAALEAAQREFGGWVAVLSPEPEFTLRLFPEATVVPYAPLDQRLSQRWKRFRRNWRTQLKEAFGNFTKPSSKAEAIPEWEDCLHQADRLFLAGGGYLSDLFPMNFALPPIHLAVKLNLPIATAPIGIGPFKTAVWADIVTGLLRHMDLKVRDVASFDFCQKRGVRASLVPDDAFAWLSKQPNRFHKTRPANVPRKIGVCIFPQYGQPAGCDLSNWWVECLRGLKAQFPGFEIEGFCFHTSPQAEFRELIRLFVRAGLRADQVRMPTMDFRQAVQTLAEYELIISTRFHAVVVANVMGVPNVAIAAGEYYQAKMTAAVAGHEALSCQVNPAQLSSREMLERCRQKLARG